MQRALVISLLATAVTLGCRQTYAPPAVANPPHYVVVEGFICNDGLDPTSFNLSQTTALSDTSVYTPITDAHVMIEDSTGGVYPLSQGQNGTYYYPPFTFTNQTKYRLHFYTGTKEEYASDYFPLVANPPIDSINWVRRFNAPYEGVTIYANTHDPQNNTHYYRWSCEETWEFHVKYNATIFWDGNGVQPFLNTKYYCWKSDNSHGIVLASSDRLSSDIIYEAPIIQIPLNSQKLQIKYSVLVKQYAITKEAFDWWGILQKNTEQIGSIFGVQPSANKGNIHCISDTTLQAIGFVGGGNIRQQRIFISNDEVQPWDYEDGCSDTKIGKGEIQFYINGGFLLYGTDGPAFKVSYDYCVDCTLTGTNIKPSFWQ